MADDADRAKPVRALLISGSLRTPSFTRALSRNVEVALVEAQAEPVRWDLAELPLPVADPRFHRDPSTHVNARVRELVALADDCDALVLASPVYHNSFSGALKNALDTLAIQQFEYKPVGLVSHGGHRSTQAVDQLRIVVRGLRGIAVPTQVCTARDDYGEEDDGRYDLVAADVLQRVRLLAMELTLMAVQLRPLRRILT